MIFEYVKIANEHGGFGMVDDLHMSYLGNRLMSMHDDASHLIYAAAADFGGNPRQVYKLTYNTGTGSLVSDEGRNIAKIEYDNLGNPIRIQFTNGNVTKYVYSAAGEKLKVISQTAVPNISVAIGSTKELATSQIQYTDSVDYLLGGSLTLRNGRIDQYQFDEGYCQAEVYSSTIDKFTFCYYDQDHLGRSASRKGDAFVVLRRKNIRQVTKADGSTKGKVIQKVNYYPFGLQLCDGTTDSNVQSHRYNGKELDKMHGLNTYDYGARQYNPVTARWDRMDPHCESYYFDSPYSYCKGNPINKIDPDGKDDFFAADGTYSHSTRTGRNIMIENDNSFINITEKQFLTSHEKDAIISIATHYISQIDNNIPNVDTYVRDGVAMAYSPINDSYSVGLDSNGFVNSSMGNIDNFINICFHEYTHRSDDTTRDGSLGEVKTILKQIEHSSWLNVTAEFATGQAGYAATSLSKAPKEFWGEYTIKLNDAFKGVATFKKTGDAVEFVSEMKELICTGKKPTE